MVVGTRKSKNMTKTRPSSWPRICLLIVTLLLEYSVGQSINTLTAESQVAIEGQETTTLPCYYKPPNAVIGKYYWKKGDEVIARKGADPTLRYSLSDPKQVDTAGYVSLTINAVSRQDTDSYTCGVNDESTGATILFQKNCTLNVYYLDKPTLSVLGGDLEVVRGSNVTMFCNSTDANPKSITRKWFHDNKMLENLKSEKHTLEIESFDVKNEGQYTCKVENEFLLDDNGKISNSLILSLKGEVTALPSTSSSGAIVTTVVILAIVIIVILVIGYVIYSKKKEKRDINTIMKTITNKMKSHTLIQHLPDSSGDFGEKYDVQQVKVNKKLVKDEPIKFKRGEIIVPRGSHLEAPFVLTYTEDQLLNIIKTGGFTKPYFDFVLKLNKNQDKTKMYLPNIYLNCKSKISKDVKGAEGSLESRFATDDDEGCFGCFVNVKQEPKQSGAQPTTIFRFSGELSIRLTNVIHRNTNGTGILFSAGGVVLNNRAFLLLNDNEKYIMCKGIPDTTQASPITWDEDANVLIQTEKEFQLLSYASLPGIRSPYILVGVVNVSKYKIKRRLVTVFSNRNPSFLMMDEIIKTLELNGSVEDLKFDNLSGRRLSSGRLVVGGWVKRKVFTAETEDNYRPSRINELRIKYLPLSARKQTDIENQSFSYQPFILWTDNEIEWKIVYLNMDNAEDNMRIQLIETDVGQVRAIVSLLQSSKVLYEGVSEDNCTTFEAEEEKSTIDRPMPVVSVALSSDASFVCVPTIHRSDEDGNHKQTTASATEEPLCTDRKQGTIAGLETSLFGKLFAKDPKQESQKESEDFVLGEKDATESITEEPLDTERKQGLKNSVEKVFAPVTNQEPQNENEDFGGMKEENPNAELPKTSTNEAEEEKTTDETTKKRGVFKKAKGKFFNFKSKKNPSSDAEYESVPTNEESNETPKEEAAAVVEEETEIDEDDIQGTSQQEPDESTPCVGLQKDGEEKESKRGLKNPFKWGKSKVKTKKESKAIEEELASNQEKSNKNRKTEQEEVKKKPIEFEGLWHFLEDTTDSKVIRLKPIHARSGTNYNSIDILQNRSKVKCEQIVPFINDGKSWFLMIYTTNFEEDDDRGHCIRYHVFSLDSLKESMNN